MVALLAPMSASAKRRTRTQRVAVRKAVEQQIEVDSDNPKPAIIRVDLSHDLHERLGKIETSLEALLHQSCFNMYWFSPWWPTDEVTFGQQPQESCEGDVGIETGHSVTQGTSYAKEPDANEPVDTLYFTVPTDSRAGQEGEDIDTAANDSHLSAKGDFRSLPSAAWIAIHDLFSVAVPCSSTSSAHADPDICSKCEARVSDCFCWDIYCRDCIRTALNCTCKEPQFRGRICSTCGCREQDTFSLYSEDLPLNIEPLGPFKCEECNGQEYHRGDWNAVQSAKECGECLQLGYHALEWCAGRECASDHLFHTSCMTAVGKEFMCRACLAAGATTQESEDEEGDEDADCVVVNTSTEMIETADEWPNFSEEQQQVFQEWFFQKRRRRQELLEKAINDALDRAEQAQSRNQGSVAKQWIHQAKSLKSQIEDGSNTEQIKIEAWRFVRETNLKDCSTSSKSDC